MFCRSYKSIISPSGLNQNLELELFAGFQDQIPSFSITFGFKIIIFNQTEDINHIVGFRKISIPTNLETNIAMTRQYVEKLKTPYSKCEINDNEPVNKELFKRSEFYQLVAAKNKTYRQKSCYRNCLQKIVVKKCGCIIGDAGKILTILKEVGHIECAQNFFMF